MNSFDKVGFFLEMFCWVFLALNLLGVLAGVLICNGVVGSETTRTMPLIVGNSVAVVTCAVGGICLRCTR